MTTTARADRIDARLLSALARSPRLSAIALAERAGISRNTVQARLDKWDQGGVLLPFDRRIEPSFLGFPMRAFVRARVKQRLLAQVSAALAGIPEVVEVLGLSGGADLLIQVVARDADDLYRVAGQILDVPGVRHTNTSLVMRQLVDHRLNQLLDVADP
ncbi:Lrp/AsnC family transcriptional regulator [Mycobacterium yunnanensis]|uniref:Lrp/AsnC family transcriptional regulator n=1 Tax=Mycobacterium yunnanensis TaxID=368477 RepID=A0A9X2YZM4_9MYCO|nr:Lrp/AsnC family transcriptional regulator [Mycobacterium yunnanensis]MCV7420465.1 Lrp/AsnC family transcriptional regulator [Mycobacterium yunnanensis]